MFEPRETFDSLIRREVAAGEIAGASAMVLHRGREVYFNTFGYADKENGVPIRRDTIFRLFSMTKPITSAAVMLLAERGDIDLRDPVSKYLPEFQGQRVWNPGGGTVAAERESTVWDMLNMLSGIPYPCVTHEPGRQMDRLFQELLERRIKGEAVTTRDYLERIAKIPLVFQPGTKWMYGLSADVLGGVVEAVSGKRYGEFLQEELFAPLQMKDTGFCVPERKKARFSRNYIWEDGKGLVPYTGCHLGEYYGEDVAFESGGAGLVSTVDDYSHFVRMLLDKGKYEGKRILGRKTVEFMAQDRLTEAQKVDYDWDSTRGYGYGCLMRVLVDQGRAQTIASPGEFGWDGWTGNYMTIDPSEDLAIIYFIQRCAGGSAFLRKLRMAVYASLDEL